MANEVQLTTTRLAESGEVVISYSAEQELQFCRRLHDSWRDLAMVLEIPGHDRRRFTVGSEAAEIWAWLESRGQLDLLPAALQQVGRDDLVAVVMPVVREHSDEGGWVRRAQFPQPAEGLWGPAPDSTATVPADPTSAPRSAAQNLSRTDHERLRRFARVRMSFGSPTGMSAFCGRFFYALGCSVTSVLLLDLLVALPVHLATVLLLPMCAGWALWRAWLVVPIVRRWRHPDTAVKIVVGNLFAQTEANLVIGFTDTFDTSIADERIIAASSLQGQLVLLRYGGDHRRLDADLTPALSQHQPVAVEDRNTKPLGKLLRYAVGTVAVLDRPGRHTFLVAYSRMGNDLVPRSSVNDIWHSLTQLWAAIDRHALRQPVAMPVVGSSLARIDTLSPQELLRLILLSYLSKSRESAVSRELRLVISPGDVGRFDLPEIARFLKRL